MSSGLTGARFRPRRVLGGSLPRRSPRLMAAIPRLDADAILRDAGLLGRLLETSPRPAPGRAGDLREPAVPVPPSRAGRAIKMVRTRANYQNMTKRPDAADAHDVQYEPLSRPTASAGRIFPCSMNLFDPQIHLKLGYRVESAFFGLSSCDNRRCPRQASATASQIAPSAQRTPVGRCCAVQAISRLVNRARIEPPGGRLLRRTGTAYGSARRGHRSAASRSSIAITGDVVTA